MRAGLASGRNIKHQMVAIDSRSRDSRYADNDYMVSFERFTNVVSIKLVSAIIHNSLVDIDATNNTLDFEVTYNLPAAAQSVLKYSATIPHGSYTGTQLQVAMQSQINDQTNATDNVPAILNVWFSERDNRFSFTVRPMRLTMLGDAETSLLTKIGFSKQRLSTTQTLTGDNTDDIQVVVNNTNNTIDFEVSDASGPAVVYNVTIPDGTYTLTTLRTAMQDALTLAAPGTVTVSYAEGRVSFTLELSHQFRLLGATGTTLPVNLMPVLGFPLADTNKASALLAPVATVREDYVLLQLIADNVELNSMRTSDGVNAFAKITTEAQLFTDQFNVVQSVGQTYPVTQPLSNLMNMNVRILRRDGSLHNKQHWPNSFTLDIAYLE